MEPASSGSFLSAGWSAIESKGVDGAAWDTGENTLLGELNDARANGVSREALESKEIGSKAGDVGSSHGSSRNGVGAVARPGRKDIDTGSKNVDESAIVGEGGAYIAAIGSTDGEGSGFGGWRVVGGIGVRVTGCDSKEDTGLNGGGDSVIHGLVLTTTERHVGNGTLGAVTGWRIGGNVIDTSNDTSECTGTARIQNLNGVQLRLFGHSICDSSNSTSNVSTMAIAVKVLTISSEVLEPLSTAFKLRVIDFDTGVNHIAAGSLSSRAVIGVCGTTLLGVGDTGEAPRGASLGLVLLCVDLNILVNVLNSAQGLELLDSSGRDAAREAGEARKIKLMIRGAGEQCLGLLQVLLGGFSLQLDNEFAGDKFRVPRNNNRCRKDIGEQSKKD